MGKAALKALEPLRSPNLSAPLSLELADARAWSHLSLYYAEKLRAAVAYRRFIDERDSVSREGRRSARCVRPWATGWIWWP